MWFTGITGLLVTLLGIYVAVVASNYRYSGVIIFCGVSFFIVPCVKEYRNYKEFKKHRKNSIGV